MRSALILDFMQRRIPKEKISHHGRSLIYIYIYMCVCVYYEGDSISKLQIVIEKNRMEILTYKQHLFFNIISMHI